MTGHFLGQQATPRPQNSPIEDYLANLAKDLPGPRTARAAAVDEIRDGLIEGITRRTAGGLPTETATRAVLAELGPPGALAQALATELATVQARRTLLAFLTTGPLIGMCWLLLLAPHSWPPQPGSMWAAVPALPIIAVCVATTVITLATTGSLIRWLPESGPQQALLATTGVGIGCVLADLTVLTTLAVRTSGTDWQPPLALAAAASAASLVRIACACRAMRRCRSTLKHLPPRAAARHTEPLAPGS
ncbi:MAG: permease prefix domain 1-containing protein [Dermatophilaceae bacterium]